MRGLYASALRLFGRLPVFIRHRVVGMTSPAYRIGTVAVIITDDGRVLLVQHTYRNGWRLPGGMIGWREEPLETIKREIKEEVNLVVEEVGPNHVEHMGRPRRVEWYFDLQLAEGCLDSDAKISSPEIDEVRWFALDDLPPLERETPTAHRALLEIAGRRFPGVLKL